MKRESIALLTVTLGLVMVGVLMVYSSTVVRNASYSDFQKHLVLACAGLFGMAVASRFDYHRFQEPFVYRLLALGTVGLTTLVFVPGLGVERYGAVRWLALGPVQFQPSELVKIALVIGLAVKLSENQERVKSLTHGFLPPVLIGLAFSVPILLQPDLGIPVVLMAAAGFMVLNAGARWVYFAGSIGAGAAGVFALCYTSEYRWRRLLAFRDPWSDYSGSGYNLIHSWAAFARGSATGVGMGASEQKLHYLPEAPTDFIFAVWGEETGLAGSLALVLLFVAFLFIGMRIARCAPDLLGLLLASGAVAMIALQAAFNMAVATGLVPTKGLPLPFVSYGGTALVVSLTLVGIILNVGVQALDPAQAAKLAKAG